MTLIVLLTALAISMAMMPIMIRLAPRLRMVDLPDPRKVHCHAVPRVGGIAITAGAIAATVLWLPAAPWLQGYLVGSLVLLVFGAADDSLELGHYPKFIGQAIAAVAVVYWGGLWVEHFPLLWTPLSPAIGKPFTVFALVGVINAINHSDGLDGLAGGESLLSMSAMAYLAYLADGTAAVLLAVAVIGGVFGFLRFNTHPAQVFMGDSGSQYIGFSLGVLAILLTQRVNPSLSMALPILLIGLPVVDILAVFGQRIQGGMNWFRATRNHIHHRLLDLGFAHHQVVMLIYSVQALLVLSALLMAYESDLAVLAVYAGVCVAVFGLIVLAERSGWRWRPAAPTNAALAGTPAVQAEGGRSKWLAGPTAFIGSTVPLYLLASGLAAAKVPGDIAAVATSVIGLASLSLFARTAPTRLMLLRLALYLGAACAVFIWHADSDRLPGAIRMAELAYFVLLGIAVALGLRLAAANGFRTTPLDLLFVLAVAAVAMLSPLALSGSLVPAVIVRLVILFYASELVINSGFAGGRRWSQVSLIGSAALLLGKTLSLA